MIRKLLRRLSFFLLALMAVIATELVIAGDPPRIGSRDDSLGTLAGESEWGQISSDLDARQLVTNEDVAFRGGCRRGVRRPLARR